MLLPAPHPPRRTPRYAPPYLFTRYPGVAVEGLGAFLRQLESSPPDFWWDAFEAAVDAARPGMKEYELVGVIHGTYLRHGGSLYGAAR